MNNFIDLLNFNYQSKHISGLNNELKSLFLLGLMEKNNKSILLVTSTLYEANMLYTSISKHYKDTYLFPMDDFLTSVAIATSPELKVNRLETLNALLSDNKSIVVTNLMGYLRFLPTKSEYANNFIKLSKGQSFDINELASKLYDIGYRREVITNTTGDMSLRGYVIDIFPIGETNPIRIEFWGDEVDSIRVFDVDTQLTISNIDDIIIKPNNNIIINNDMDVNAYESIDSSKVTNISTYKDFDIIFNNYHDIEVNYKQLEEEMYEYAISKELSSNTRFMFNLYDINVNPYYFDEFDNIEYLDSINAQDVESFKGDENYILKRLKEYKSMYKLVVICVNNRYHANKILDMDDSIILTDIDNLIQNKINVVIKNIASGFIYNGIVVISESELFNKKEVSNVYHSKFKIGTKIRDIAKLNEGDYVVHQVHGIGKYLGIKVLVKNGLKKDYLMIEYRDGDKLYIPVEKIDNITKYSSNEELIPKLSKLGGAEWAKTKVQVKKRAASIAKELLALYVEREKKIGYAFQKDGEEQLQFEKEFTYAPTVDQIRVTDEVKKDMESTHPMDRLVCGDVGFGKTEIAFRAIFKAIMSGKQAAILCPTTILSEQHYQNALNRFSSFPVNIAILNRFVTPAKAKKILEDLSKGVIDLVIGTHRILSDDVKFKNLGLLVVDEEQRFGVKHKEKIKEYKNNIDVLTLSATPIPRTLQMSMSGLRSLSLLETPPQNRYPVQTYVLENNNAILKDAIYKELSRGGQVFILYNSVIHMEEKLKELSKIVPEARIVVAHGQMNKTELEDKMFSFINHEYDVLLCTTIIETGIDIPNVNTLIIMNADDFGLSQLYQIRGRVGRSNKIAYCYLMYNKGKILTEQATKRLKVIKEFTELGSGFSIAMRDLSIRGAGNILGSEQSGYIDSVGVELFMKMLDEAIKHVGEDEISINDYIEEKLTPSEPLVEVETNISDNYVSESELKIQIHKEINNINNYEDLSTVSKNLEDRFGKLPENIIIYMYETWFEKKASELNIKNVKQTKNSIEITLPKELTDVINGEKLFVELYSLSKMFRLSMKFQRLIITLDIVKLDKHFIYYLIDMLDIINESIKK